MNSNITINTFRQKNTRTKFTVLRSLTVPSSAFQEKRITETPMWLRLNFRVELQMNSHAKNLNLAIVYFHGEFFFLLCAVIVVMLLLFLLWLVVA